MGEWGLMSTKNFSVWRKRESFCANLQNGRPPCADGLAGQGVEVPVGGNVVAATVDQAEGLKGSDGVISLLRAIALHNPVELAEFIQNRDGLSDATPPPFVGFFVAGGEYFWIDREGCYSLNELCFQGRLHPIDKAEFSWVMAYFHKYVLKSQAVAA